MKITKLIFKGILFYGSIIFWIILICGIDSILEMDLYWQFLFIGLADILILYIFISPKDAEILTFSTNQATINKTNNENNGQKC